MKQRHASLIAAGLVLGLLGAWGGARAEVSASRGSSDSARTLIMGDTRVGITDGADPVLSVPWTQYRPQNSHNILNPNGEIRPDGRPDIFFRSSKQWPFVVWAYNNGPDHDIAFSGWNGTGWSPTEMLTSGPEDEVDPRIFITDEGVIYVTWWVNAESPYVMAVTRRLTLPDWDQPVRVNPVDELAVRPTILHFDGVVRVAYELGTVGGVEILTARELVIRRRAGNGEFALEHTLAATDPGALNPVFGTTATKMYVTWRNSVDEYGCSVWTNSGWSEPFYQTLDDPTWVGIESVRINLNRAIQALPDTTPDDPADVENGLSGTPE